MRASTLYPVTHDDRPGRSDDAIVCAVRGGDVDAFHELWRRYLPLAITVARATTSRFEAEDIAAEAFARVLGAIRSGGGPVTAFRAYLLTVLRNTARSWGTATREYAVADPYALAGVLQASFDDDDDDPYIIPAFRSLPDRMRSVLWYRIVDGYSSVEVARLLDISPNAAGVVAFRAREALRQAWIQVQLEATPTTAECSFAVAHLGAFARQGVTGGRRERMRGHFEVCPTCAVLERRACELGARFDVPVALSARAS